MTRLIPLFTQRAPIRSLTLALSLALVGAGLLAGPVQAQEEPDDGEDFVVLSENQVPSEKMDKLTGMADTTASVVLDQLVEEGLLKDWGVLRHAWGNQWNYNIYYVTESHAAFVKFWDEFTSRMQEQHPAAGQKITSMFEAHRDNMYVRPANP